MGRRRSRARTFRKLSGREWVVLGILLVLPSVALWKVMNFLNAGWILAGLAGVWLVTLLLYWRDKRQAQKGGWRTPESTLHLLELAGGWPVAFVAQRWFRHKIAKRKFQVIFWIIVASHQIVAAFEIWS